MSSSKLIKNTLSLGVVQAVNYVFPLFTVPYVSRIIGPEGYGIFNYSTVFVGYFTLLIAYGFDLTGTRKIAKSDGDIIVINTIVSEVLSSRILLFFVSALLFVLSLFFFKPIQKDIWTVSILFIGALGTVISPQYIFQGLQELSIFAKLNFIRGLLNLVLIFILIKKSEDYIFLAVLSAFFTISINVFLFIYAFFKFKLSIQLIPIKKSLKIIFGERMIFFSTVVISLYTSTNTIVLGFFADTKEIGYYTTSQSFLNIVNSIIAIPLSTALFPFVGKSFAISKENGINTIKRVMPIVFYLTLGASICLLVFAPIAIRLFYGHKFDQAIPALQIISFLPFIIGMSNVFGIQLMLNLGLDKLFFKVTFFASIIGVVLNIFMSKMWGYIGAAWNCIIIECFVTLVMYYALKRKGIHFIKYSLFSFNAMKGLLKSIKKS